MTCLNPLGTVLLYSLMGGERAVSHSPYLEKYACKVSIELALEQAYLLDLRMMGESFGEKSSRVINNSRTDKRYCNDPTKNKHT